MYDKKIKAELTWYTIYLILALVTPIVSHQILCFFSSETMSSAMVFQRSGSVMVIFALLSESRAINVFFILNPATFGESGINEARLKYNKLPERLNFTSFSVIAIGTLIWGYGDLMFSFVIGA